MLNSSLIRIPGRRSLTGEGPCSDRGVYLTDLTLVDEGNLEFVDGNLVNFTKKQLEYNIIVQVLRYQQTSFQFHLVGDCAHGTSPLPY